VLLVAAVLASVGAIVVEHTVNIQHSGSTIQRLDRIETLLLKGDQ